MSKWPVAGVIAGIAMFVWGAIFHMALGIEMKVMKTFRDDAAVTAVLKEKVTEPGFYFFPNEADPAKMEEIIKTTPRGVMIYQPAGTPFSMPSSLGTQLVLDILTGLVLAWLLNMVRAALPGMGSRICFAATAGALGLLAIILPWWNWYGMPLGMVGANFVEQLVGFAAAGAVLAKLMK